jgi:hypothetical protein
MKPANGVVASACGAIRQYGINGEIMKRMAAMAAMAGVMAGGVMAKSAIISGDNQ